jgi:uncharacterized protein HemX
MVAALVLVALVCALAGGWWSYRQHQREVARLQALLNKPRVAEAVFAAANVRQNKGRAKQIEAAMSQAVHDALAEGVPMADSDTIRARMLAARARVLSGDA